MGGRCRLEVGLQVAVSFPGADITYVGAEAISESCRALARVVGGVLVVALFLILPEVLSAQVPTVPCSSTPGNRQECAADTSKGVALAKSTGESPCLLGKSWGYDDRSIWVSDGCSGEFVAGQAIQEATERKGDIDHIPNIGFRLYTGEKGEIYVRLFSYARYLNQKGLDAEYTDFFGNSHTVAQRQDVQLNKFFLPFSGWFLTPKFRYYLYVWSSNLSQGDPAQVVGAGNLSYTINRYATFGAGITSLPSVRSTEGQFPYWLGVDDRLDCRRVFQGVVHFRLLAQGRIVNEAQVHGHVRQQPEHARRERGATG